MKSPSADSLALIDRLILERHRVACVNYGDYPTKVYLGKTQYSDLREYYDAHEWFSCGYNGYGYVDGKETFMGMDIVKVVIDDYVHVC